MIVDELKKSVADLERISAVIQGAINRESANYWTKTIGGEALRATTDAQIRLKRFADGLV